MPPRGSFFYIKINYTCCLATTRTKMQEILQFLDSLDEFFDFEIGVIFLSSVVIVIFVERSKHKMSHNIGIGLEYTYNYDIYKFHMSK